jgi:hypothetical protein
MHQESATMSRLAQLCEIFKEVIATIKRRARKFLRRANHDQEQEQAQMYEVIQQLRTDELDGDDASSSSDSVSSFGYEEPVSPLSSSNNSLA